MKIVFVGYMASGKSAVAKNLQLKLNLDLIDLDFYIEENEGMSVTEIFKKGHIKLNGTNLKPSKEVYIGEKLLVRKNQINYELEILDVPKSRVGAKLVDLYRKDTTPKEQFEALELLKYSKDYYRKKGVGRPTKKDRRDIDDYISDEGDV